MYVVPMLNEESQENLGKYESWQKILNHHWVKQN